VAYARQSYVDHGPSAREVWLAWDLGVAGCRAVPGGRHWHTGNRALPRANHGDVARRGRRGPGRPGAGRGTAGSKREWVCGVRAGGPYLGGIRRKGSRSRGQRRTAARRNNQPDDVRSPGGAKMEMENGTDEGKGDGRPPRRGSPDDQPGRPVIGKDGDVAA